MTPHHPRVSAPLACLQSVSAHIKELVDPRKRAIATATIMMPLVLTAASVSAYLSSS